MIFYKKIFKTTLTIFFSLNLLEKIKAPKLGLHNSNFLYHDFAILPYIKSDKKCRYDIFLISTNKTNSFKSY